MKYRITILCENSTGPISGTLGEHGFAALVEFGDKSLLFDTGNLTLLHNAQRMNRDLRKIEAVAISHGHYDHTGGLLPLLATCGGREVLAHPGIFTPRYRVKDTGESISIGIPYGEDYLRGQGARFSYSSQFREIAPDIFLTGEVLRVSGFETGDSGLFLDTRGDYPDRVTDDQSMVIRSERGLTLLLGCCHAGLINTVEHCLARTGAERIHTIIGGTHLGFCGQGQLDATLSALRGYGVNRIIGSHCTGFAAAATLLREFPGKFQPAQVGYTLEV